MLLDEIDDDIEYYFEVRLSPLRDRNNELKKSSNRSADKKVRMKKLGRLVI